MFLLAWVQSPLWMIEIHRECNDTKSTLLSLDRLNNISYRIMSIDNKHLFLIKNSFKSGIKNILNMIKGIYQNTDVVEANKTRHLLPLFNMILEVRSQEMNICRLWDPSNNMYVVLSKRIFLKKINGFSSLNFGYSSS